jgi:predicted nucleic acid-binding protein
MIVFDASTLILITKIELLDAFLASVDQKSAIPSEVKRECCDMKSSLDAFMIQKVVHESRIEVMTVSDRTMVRKLQADFGLGLGEAEAIALGFRKKANLIAIDDKNGINACKLLGIPFTTALAILVRSYEKGLTGRVEAIEKLTVLAKVGRYQRSIMEKARMTLESRQ